MNFLLRILLLPSALFVGGCSDGGTTCEEIRSASKRNVGWADKSPTGQSPNDVVEMLAAAAGNYAWQWGSPVSVIGTSTTLSLAISKGEGAPSYGGSREENECAIDGLNVPVKVRTQTADGALVLDSAASATVLGSSVSMSVPATVQGEMAANLTITIHSGAMVSIILFDPAGGDQMGTAGAKLP